LILQCLAADTSIEQCTDECVATRYANFPPEQQPELSQDGIYGPHLLAAITYRGLGTYGREVVRVISHQEREQRARINEEHARRH
jgi:hypothetical protein